MSERYIAVSEKNEKGIVQYVSVNIGDMLEYIDDMGSYAEEPAYISIGYYDSTYKSRYTEEFPCIDINMYLSGAITVYDDMSFIRHFKNDPGKILDIYNHIVLLTNVASYSMNYEDIFVVISNKIFEILKEWVHPLDGSEEYGLSVNYGKMFSEAKYKSTFLVSLEKVGREEYCCNTTSFVSSEIMQDEPILYLSKTVERNSEEFLIYPDGSIFVKDFPTWQHFDDIKNFGGVRILEFCEECSSYYKFINGDLSRKDSFDKYESLIRDLTRDLKAWRG